MSSGTSKKKLLRFCHSDCLRQLPLVALWRSSDWNKWWLCQWLTELQLTFFCFLWKHFYSEAVEIRRRCCNSYIYAIYCKSFFPRIFFNDFGAILKYFGVSLNFLFKNFTQYYHLPPDYQFFCKQNILYHGFYFL